MAKLCATCQDSYLDELTFCPRCQPSQAPNEEQALQREFSPLSAPVIDAAMSRVDIQETEVDGPTAGSPNGSHIGNLADQDSPLAVTCPASSAEFDLTGLWNDEKDANLGAYRPDQNGAGLRKPNGHAEDFGIQLWEDEAVVETDFERRLDELAQEISDPNVDVSSSLPAGAGPLDFPPLAPTSNSVAPEQCECESPPFELPARNGHSYHRNGAGVEFRSLELTKASGSKQWLGGMLAGLLFGVAICAGIWTAGLKLPPSWKSNSDKSEAARANPGSEKQSSSNEQKPAPDSAPVNPEKSLAARELLKGIRDFELAMNLAQKHRYSEALVIVQKPIGSTIPPPKPDPEVQAITAALNRTRDLVASFWRLEKSFRESGYLSDKQQDPIAALNRLRADEQALQKQMATVRSGLETLRKVREAAERQASELAASVAKLSENQSAANLAVATLDKKLKLTEGKLREAEARLKQTQTVKHTVLKPAAPPAEEKSVTPHTHYLRGVSAYRIGLFTDAEKEFQKAVRSDSQDARYHYYLALACWSQGKKEDANTSFRKGAQLERENKPSQVFVALALEAIKGEARATLSSYRPIP